MGTYPVALGRVVLRAVGDLGLAIVQDAPDDRNAGHLIPAADRVLGLLKRHDPAGCKDPGGSQGHPAGRGPFSTTTCPLALPIPPHPTAVWGEQSKGVENSSGEEQGGWNRVPLASWMFQGRERSPGRDTAREEALRPRAGAEQDGVLCLLEQMGRRAQGPRRPSGCRGMVINTPGFPEEQVGKAARASPVRCRVSPLDRRG